MLRLRKVELFGFKSFSRRTQITFGGTGIAAIVGPNGCGKSNIADAILWVLGEQSPRTLRSGRMADCIFNGTATELPTNLAEVTLWLVDPAAIAAPPPEPPQEAAAPGEATASAEPKRKRNRLNLKILPGEMVVTRRLYRSGESEYYLNGELCRLRDIQELFMGTGLGPESYAIIEQGRIGQILSSRPSDRRAIIEEAASVSRYKTKRRLAEAKLESAQQNLLRLSDIFEEVTRQLNSLKRQAARARRFQELKAETTRLRRALLASHFQSLRASQAALAAQLQANAGDLERLTAEVRSLEQAHEQNQARSYELEDTLRRQQSRAGELAIEAERARTRVADAQREYDELGRQLAELSRQQDRLRQQLEQNRAAAAANQASLLELEQQVQSARAALQSHTAERDRLAGEIRAHDIELERIVEEHAARLNQLAALRAEKAHLKEIAPATVAHLQQLTEKQARAAQEKKRLEQERVELETALTQARRELQQAHAAVRAAEAALAAAHEQERKEKERSEAARQALAAVEAQKEALTTLLAERAAFAEPVQQLLRLDSGSTGLGFRAVGVVADFAEFNQQYAPLLEEYLHDELQYVVVETYEAARSGVEILREQATGRATFLVDSFGRRPLEGEGWRLSEAEAAALHTGNGVVAPLRELVRLNGPLGEEAARVLPRLSRTYLVRTPQAAEQMARRYPQLFFLATDGTCYHGRLVSGGSRNGHGPVSLRRDVETVSRRREELAPTVSSLQAALQAAETQAAACERELTAARQFLFAREKELIQQEHHLETLSLELTRWAQAEQDALAELESQTNAQDGVARRSTDLTRQEEHSAAAVAELEARMASLRAALVELRRQQALTASHITDQSARLAALEERQTACGQEQNRLEMEHAQGVAEQRRQEELTGTLNLRRAESERARTEGATARDLCEQEKRAAEAACEETTSRLASLRQGLLETEGRLRAQRAELETLRAARHALEVEQARLETQASHLEASCQSEFGLTGAQLASDVESLAGEALAQAEENYRQLKDKLENLGPVNMMALEEFQEVEQRHSFLTQQREDLLASIADTHRAIQEIDAVCARQFEEAFSVINQHFAETFRVLFGGGSASLRLTDAENPAECGIDLICQPPGKRLQNVLLLSGGEKALAAIALLIAIFRYQPSPFCILDEVDAPLDEANVGRFAGMIQEMSTQTQFILITHNKKTMEICPVLYGVTMQGGISQIVSVRFDEPVTSAA